MGSMGQVALDCQGEKLAELADCSYFAVGLFARGLARTAARADGSWGSERAARSDRFPRNGASQADSSLACETTTRSIPSWSSVVAFLFFGVFIGASP